jgi:monoamine oxidase
VVALLAMASEDHHHRVVVVGGGLAGLAAARLLHDHYSAPDAHSPAAVLLLEAAASLGGRIQHVTGLAPWPVEVSQRQWLARSLTHSSSSPLSAHCFPFFPFHFITLPSYSFPCPPAPPCNVLYCMQLVAAFPFSGSSAA